MRIDGGCHCGAIAYEAEVDPAQTVICHCTDCQQLSGSAFRVVVFTKPGSLKLTAGTPKTYVKTAESGNQRAQAFCGACGSPIYSTALGGDDNSKVYGVRVGTVRQRSELVPTMQSWCRSEQPWLDAIGSITRNETQRPMSPSGGIR